MSQTEDGDRQDKTEASNPPASAAQQQPTGAQRSREYLAYSALARALIDDSCDVDDAERRLKMAGFRTIVGGATGFRIRRSDGTWAVNFTFETQEEAQEVCDSLFETRFPFAYAVVRVCQ